MQYRQQRHPPTAQERRRHVFTSREKEAAAQHTTDHAAMPYPITATGRAKVARQQTTSAGEYDADDDYDDVVSPHVAAIVPRYNRIPTADGYIEKRGNQHMHVHFVDTPSQVARASRTTAQAPEQRPTHWEKPRRRFHWLFFVGIALLVMLVGYIGFGALGSWWHIHQDDSTYGRPRTFQIDAVPTQVQSYMLPEIIVTGEKEALSTGSIHQPATAATGLITFYNGSFTTQVVPAGIILQGNGGRRISTDQQARIPPATPTTPPTYGTVSVIAHSLLLGAVGNIPDQDINDACCGVSLLAQNIYPFSGGRDARDITVVTANDIATAVAAPQTNLDQETHDQAQAEMKPGQQELPLVCTTSTTANHRPGDQAQQVHVTVTKHCLAPAYTLSGVWQQVTRAIAKSIPSSYRLVRVTILLLTATVTDGKRGAGTLSLHITASLAFVPAGNRNSHGSGK